MKSLQIRENRGPGKGCVMATFHNFLSLHLSHHADFSVFFFVMLPERHPNMSPIITWGLENSALPGGGEWRKGVRNSDHWPFPTLFSGLVFSAPLCPSHPLSFHLFSLFPSPLFPLSTAPDSATILGQERIVSVCFFLEIFLSSIFLSSRC